MAAMEDNQSYCFFITVLFSNPNIMRAELRVCYCLSGWMQGMKGLF